MSKFSVKAGEFEGPLDVLLDLIEKRKLLINEVSLAQVTDEFIKYVENSPSIELGEKTEFIVTASTLLLIKSRSLLPGISLGEEEEDSIEDLEKRLKLYKRFKDLAEHIKTLYGKEPLRFALPKKIQNIIFSPHDSITLSSIHEAAKSALQKAPRISNEPTVAIKKVISIEEMINRLTSKVQQALKMSFKDFTGREHHKTLSREERVEVIVGFLAMLELVKQGVIDAKQQDTFGEIHMETENIGTPRY